MNQLIPQIGAEFIKYLQDAATARELYVLLKNHIADKKGLLIWEGRSGNYVVGRTDGLDNGVFQSASYTACVEWCLDQPDVKAE